MTEEQREAIASAILSLTAVAVTTGAVAHALGWSPEKAADSTEDATDRCLREIFEIVGALEDDE